MKDLFDCFLGYGTFVFWKSSSVNPLEVPQDSIIKTEFFEEFEGDLERVCLLTLFKSVRIL